MYIIMHHISLSAIALTLKNRKAKALTATGATNSGSAPHAQHLTHYRTSKSMLLLKILLTCILVLPFLSWLVVFLCVHR